MTKTGIVEPEMSLRIRRSFSLGSRIRLAPMRRRGRLPSLWTAALSESGYIFAKASADAPTQIGACRRGIHKILGMLLQVACMSWFRNLSACKSLPETFADKRAHCGRSADAGGAGRGKLQFISGSLARSRVCQRRRLFMKPVRLVDDSPTMLSDYHMPGMHGVDLIGKWRRIASTRFTRKLVLTTDSQPEKRGAAKAAGATGWLVKPVDATALLQIVTQLSPGK